MGAESSDKRRRGGGGAALAARATSAVGGAGLWRLCSNCADAACERGRCWWLDTKLDLIKVSPLSVLYIFCDVIGGGDDWLWDHVR